MEELAAVERHLLQARARALTEQERKLSEKKQALCGYEEGINLPAGVLSPVHLHNIMVIALMCHVLQMSLH